MCLLSRCSNSKQVPVNMIIADVFPTSSDARIKVQAVEPAQSVIEEGTQQEEAARSGAFDDCAVGEVSRGAGDGGSVRFCVRRSCYL